MTAGRQRTMAPQSDTDIRVIIQEAQHRWLRPQEVCEILRNYKRHNFRLNNIPPQTPQSGSLFLFDRKTLRYFRKDGHNWRKKKDGKTVREAHERLKAGSIDVLHCYYAHGEDNHNFQRRAYWMLDPAYEHIVLVHYREVSETNRLCRVPDPVDRPVASNPLVHSQQQTQFGHSGMSSMGVANSIPSPETMDMVGTSHSPELEEGESADPDELDDAVADVIADQSVPQLSLSEQLTDPQHLPPLGRQRSTDPWDTGFSRMNSGNVDDAANPSRYMSQGDFKPAFPTVAPLSNYPTFRATGGSHMNPLSRLAADLLESPGPAFDPREGRRMSSPMDSSSWSLPPNNQGGRGPIMSGGNRTYVKSEPNSSPWSDMLAEVTTPNTMRNLLQEHGVPPQEQAQQQAQQQPHQPPSRVGREPSTSMGLPSSPKGRGISDALSPRNLGREPQSALEADLRDMSERIVLKEAAEKQQGQRCRWQPNSDRFLDATTMHVSQPKVETQTGSFMPQFGDVDTLHALVLSGQAPQESMFSAEKPWSAQADQQAQVQQSLNPYLVHNQGQSNFQSQDSKLQVFPPQQQPNALLDNMGIPFSPTIESLLKDVSRDAESNPRLESFKSNGSFGKIDSFGKLDSFGRWMNSAADISDIAQGPGSLSGQLWYPTYPEDTMAGVPQQMDEGLTPTPSLSEQLFNIVDFSPEWGFTTEDTKVIISGSFVKQPNGADPKWFCMFGPIEVPAELVGDGALRCKAPQQGAGTVPFYITCGDRQACSQVREFEYRPRGLKLLGEMNSQPTFVTDEQDTAEELLLKIRLSRMLLGLVNGRVNNRTQVFDEKDDDEWKTLEYMVHSSGKSLAEVKEQLLQTILSHKLLEWLKTKSEAEDDRGPSVLDDRGQGVPHFMAALGYDWSIQPLYAGGIPPNFRDDSGWTALHWAAKYGRENTVVALLDAGVAAPNLLSYPTHQYPRGESASDLASAGGHGGIAGFLAEKSLTERLSSMTLHDDINELEKMTANLEGEKAVAQLYRRTSLVRSVRGPDDDVKLKASLNAVRVSTQTGALLQTVYRLQSFRRRAQLEPDEYGLSEVDKSNLLAARRIQQAYRGHHRKNMMRQHLAATRIQQKFRGWKGRKEYQAMRQRIIKVQAHVRGRLVRNKYRKLLWSVSIVEKVVLRWLRKRPGLKGFQPARRLDGADDNEDVTKEGRQNAKEAVKQEIEKVITMVRQKSGREQYNRLLHEEQRTSASKNELQEQLEYYATSRDFME